MVTNETIKSFWDCHYKAYRQYHQHVGKKTDYELLEQELLTSYRTKFYQTLQTQYNHTQFLQDIPSKKTHNLLPPLYVLHPKFHMQNYAISFDAIEIASQKHASKLWSYYPTDVVPRETVPKTTKLAFTMKCVIASRSRKIDLELGKIVYGRRLKTIRLKFSDYAREARKALRNLFSIVANPDEPPFYQNKHCKICEFHDACHAVFVEKDDLSLLSGLSQKEIVKQNNRGIFTVHQFSYTFRPRRKRKGSTAQQRTEWALKALALREKQTYLQDIPKLSQAETEVYIDFEGLPDERFIYLIGLVIYEKGKELQFSFWADSPKDEEHIFQQLFNTLSPLHNVTIYHYGSYETRAFKRFKKISKNRYNEEIDAILDNSINILSFFATMVYPPTYSNELKDIARYLGFNWSDANASGIQSIVWRKKWEMSQNITYKHRLIRYNLEDCAALKTVKDWLITFEHEEDGQNCTNVADLKPQSTFKFGNYTYHTPEVKALIQYAYFDYQREKIFWKTEKAVKQAIKAEEKTLRSANSVDKRIREPLPGICPYCGNKAGFKKREKLRRINIDLNFMKNGIKRHITLVTFHKMKCLVCGRKFTPTAFNRKNFPYYGRNLMLWVVNQHIQYRLSFGKMQEMLLESFHLRIPTEGILIQFRTKLAQEYAITFQEIQQSIIHGTLIHVDETKIAIVGNPSGYVWVFTNMHSVIYLFKPTREANFLHEMLQEFIGVLISDFYPGYDGLLCQQQKCLLHLIRDLNDDLFTHPFDLELKQIVSSFGKLLQEIIGKTIHRYGLKKFHLHKHKKDAERFYRTVIEHNYESELAKQYQARFQKYKERLFTFLDYDGVPWNNNNAEHAIKPFAAYRKEVKGILSENGIRNYLIFLSIQQTCKYRGLNFLEFLKSGEKSLDVFAKKG